MDIREEDKFNNRYKQALDLMVDHETNIRDYLHLLLKTLWKEGESFSGKRPFGNSDWEDHLLIPLVVNGFVRGVVDEEGYVSMTYSNRFDAMTFVEGMIWEVFYGNCN